MTNNYDWEVYFFEYANLCRQFNEEKKDDNWEEHYEQLIKKLEDDIMGW